MQDKIVNRMVSFISISCLLLATTAHAKSLYTDQLTLKSPLSVTKSSGSYNPHSYYSQGLMAYEAEDYASAMDIFTELAKSGFANAQYYLGVMFDSAAGTEADHQQAALWYQKASRQDHPEAQYNLAIAYATGEGIGQNMRKSIYWMKKAALQGNINSQYNLGLIYILGSGVSVNVEEGVQWWTLAAKNGDNMAQYNLGMMYLQGRGVESDICQASRWWEISAANGFAQSVLALQALKQQGNLQLRCGGAISRR